MDSLDNKILTETLELSYNYFQRLNVGALGSAITPCSERREATIRSTKLARAGVDLPAACSYFGTGTRHGAKGRLMPLEVNEIGINMRVSDNLGRPTRAEDRRA